MIIENCSGLGTSSISYILWIITISSFLCKLTSSYNVIVFSKDHVCFIPQHPTREVFLNQQQPSCKEEHSLVSNKLESSCFDNTKREFEIQCFGFTPIDVGTLTKEEERSKLTSKARERFPALSRGSRTAKSTKSGRK